MQDVDGERGLAQVAQGGAGRGEELMREPDERHHETPARHGRPDQEDGRRGGDAEKREQKDGRRAEANGETALPFALHEALQHRMAGEEKPRNEVDAVVGDVRPVVVEVVDARPAAPHRKLDHDEWNDR